MTGGSITFVCSAHIYSVEANKWTNQHSKYTG